MRDLDLLLTELRVDLGIFEYLYSTWCQQFLVFKNFPEGGWLSCSSAQGFSASCSESPGESKIRLKSRNRLHDRLPGIPRSTGTGPQTVSAVLAIFSLITLPYHHATNCLQQRKCSKASFFWRPTGPENHKISAVWLRRAGNSFTRIRRCLQVFVN